MLPFLLGLCFQQLILATSKNIHSGYFFLQICLSSSGFMQVTKERCFQKEAMKLTSSKVWQLTYKAKYFCIINDWCHVFERSLSVDSWG